GDDQWEDDGSRAGGFHGSPPYDGNLGDREPGGDGPPVSSARLPLSGARPRWRAGAVSVLAGHRERAAAFGGSHRRALRRFPGEVDVPLSHPGSRGHGDDGHTSTPMIGRRS